MDYTFDKLPDAYQFAVELYKVAKERLLLTLRHPADEKTGDAGGTHVRPGMVCAPKIISSTNRC